MTKTAAASNSKYTQAHPAAEPAEAEQGQAHRSASSGRSSEVCLAQRSEFSSIILMRRKFREPQEDSGLSFARARRRPKQKQGTATRNRTPNFRKRHERRPHPVNKAGSRAPWPPFNPRARTGSVLLLLIIRKSPLRLERGFFRAVFNFRFKRARIYSFFFRFHPVYRLRRGRGEGVLRSSLHLQDV